MQTGNTPSDTKQRTLPAEVEIRESSVVLELLKRISAMPASLLSEYLHESVLHVGITTGMQRSIYRSSGILRGMHSSRNTPRLMIF